MTSTLGTFIRRRRAHLGLTQCQLADRTANGTTQIHISRLETGTTMLPQWHRLRPLAAALEVSPGELLLHAGVITPADLEISGQVPVTPVAGPTGQPRGEIHSPFGVMQEWETAAVLPA